ncbi:hypothetical protein Y032_0329g2674 [Ancylostoma ceylanicum]|nr:hypothetical protein Y032_0329g2674 [Ancylostoma ceylanicum]
MLIILSLLLSPAIALKDGEMELLLVQVIWRHGDRSPTYTFRSDPFQERNWTFGGGGYGQLSPIGMKQHFNLGKLIRNMYVDTGFLGGRYSSKEIYVRSSDLNRTIISAMSNMMGMYGQNDSIRGVDYPDVPGWPVGYVPVAVHTVNRNTDYVVIPHAPCDRQEKLWKMAKESDEVKAYLNKPEVANVFRDLTSKCGEEIDTENIWIVRDALLIEQIHANETLRKTNKWFSDEFFKKISEIDVQLQQYGNGIFSKPVIMNNLDIGLEIQKIRGGSMFNDLNMHMNMKLDCLNNKHRPRCKWISGLKYYVYSGHDTTISAFFSILRLEEVIIPRGYPAYSAAVFIELWMNTTDGQPYFKIAYHPDDVENSIYPVTQRIAACEGKIYCNLAVFRDYAAKIKPDQAMYKWCRVDPLKASAALLSLATLALSLISQASWLSY